MKVTKTMSNKNVRKAHALLAAYWAYRVISGESIPKATYKIAAMEGMSVLKERRDQKQQEQELRAAQKENLRSAGRKAPVKAGIAKNPIVKSEGKKLLKKILRSQRVI